MSVCSWVASPLPGEKGISTFSPAFLAAISIPVLPPSTIKSAIETNLFLLSKLSLIFSKVLITLFICFGSLTSQLICGSNFILAPLAPPLLSDPLYVEADAHAVLTNSETVNFDLDILDTQIEAS